MLLPQPIVIASERGRQFACSAVALQAIIVNEREEILLLASPRRYEAETWQVVSGALEAGETILAGVLREIREEAGEEIQVRPLGVVHVQTFHYDANVQYMIGIYYLLAYEGGVVRPGDDMVESLFRWWSLDELADENIRLFVPNLRWILERAVPLYRLWQRQVVDLQPELGKDET
jgi:ADP-ribose pyrophosphatase YjhB (NUDIX family)